MPWSKRESGVQAPWKFKFLKIPKNISRNPPGKKMYGSAHDSSENTNCTWIIRYLSQSSRARRSFLKSGQIFLASRKSHLLHFFSHQRELSRGLEFWRLTILFVVVFWGFFFGGGGVSICPPPRPVPPYPNFSKRCYLPACVCNIFFQLTSYLWTSFFNRSDNWPCSPLTLKECTPFI